MTRIRRIAITAGAVVVVGIAALAGRVVVMGGVFDEVKPVPLACETLKGVTGAEDIAYDGVSRTLFLSAMDRRAPGSAKDGIYAYSLDHPEKGFVHLAGAPKAFHPHGISLWRSGDSLTLMAVNHPTADRRMGPHEIDVFAVKAQDGALALNHIGAIESDRLIHPNDIVAVDQNRFYVTNDHGNTTALGREVENYLMLPRANVLYYDGAVFREAAGGLVFANGIALSPDGRHLYVAESTARRVQSFARNPFNGTLEKEASLDLPAGPDNIDVGPDGALWIAAHPKMFALVSYTSDPTKPSPTEVLKIATADGVPKSAAPVYVDDGREIGAGSVGVVAGGELYIGSIFDAKILRCRLVP
jgi:arylesterase/paraoxonase